MQLPEERKPAGNEPPAAEPLVDAKLPKVPQPLLSAVHENMADGAARHPDHFCVFPSARYKYPAIVSGHSAAE
jgi:hypothetical protein